MTSVWAVQNRELWLRSVGRRERFGPRIPARIWNKRHMRKVFGAEHQDNWFQALF